MTALGGSLTFIARHALHHDAELYAQVRPDHDIPHIEPESVLTTCLASLDFDTRP
jgi:hypothetical protein